MAELDYNAVGALTDVRRFEWDDTDELYNLIAQSQYQYNARNQITSIAHNNAAGNSIVSHGYLYNADGNISQYTNSLDGSVLYDYDFLGQLTGADYSNLLIHDELYLYDLNGNRELVTNANGDLVVYSTGTNNELTSDGAYTYAYDAEGNRISKTNAAGTERELYSWDYRNRLSSVTKQTYDSVTQEWETVQVVEYAYDYNNVLIRKVLDANGDGTADSKTLFLPENYQTAIQLDDADLSDSTYETVSHRYLWTPGQQDKLLADVTPTETLWTLTDHLSTIRDVVKNTPSGLVVPAHVIYDAYGNILSCKDANGADISNPVIFGFTGKYFDADTQLQNNVNRWYDATVGRWLSTDPIGFNGNDTNLYRYVGNGIITNIDLWGFDEFNVYKIYPDLGKNLPSINGPDGNNSEWGSYEYIKKIETGDGRYNFPDQDKAEIHIWSETKDMEWKDLVQEWLYGNPRSPSPVYLFDSDSKIAKAIWDSKRPEFINMWLDIIEEQKKRVDCSCPTKLKFKNPLDKGKFDEKTEHVSAKKRYAPIDLLYGFKNIESIGSYNMTYKITFDLKKNTIRFQGILTNSLSTSSASFNKLNWNIRNVYMAVYIDKSFDICPQKETNK